jgi:hypothetical protein
VHLVRTRHVLLGHWGNGFGDVRELRDRGLYQRTGRHWVLGVLSRCVLQRGSDRVLGLRGWILCRGVVGCVVRELPLWKVSSNNRLQCLYELSRKDVRVHHRGSSLVTNVRNLLRRGAVATGFHGVFVLRRRTVRRLRSLC